MTFGEALGAALAGYRDKDNTRCAAGLVAAVEAVRELEESNERLRKAKDSFFRSAEAWEVHAKFRAQSGVLTERDVIATKAREWAANYPEGSDGRNTFVLFAEWVEGRQDGH